MKKNNLTCIIVFLLAVTFAIVSGAGRAQAQESKAKPIRIKWESIEGIIKFIVQIKDQSDSVVLDKTVNVEYIDFTLPPGKYMIRIGAINKFEKVSFWTDWDEIEIRKYIRSKFFANEYAAKVGLKISGGVSYNMILPPWNSLYKDSAFDLRYLNYFGIIGFHFGESKYVKSDSFLKYMGIELEGSYCRYAGKGNQFSQFQSKLLNITGGPNIFIKTMLKVPINFYFRIGGGAAYSFQEYTRRNLYGQPYQKGTVKSLDPYARVGGAVELNFLYALSLDIGVDYYVTFYQDEFFQSLRYFAMIGVRI
jgi:hypothetical protein